VTDTSSTRETEQVCAPVLYTDCTATFVIGGVPYACTARIGGRGPIAGDETRAHPVPTRGEENGGTLRNGLEA
jgi:hypothetical protein